MGFGKKTDFETGRTLDLDKTYKYIIKPAVLDAGLLCIRADEITHSGPIDVPMYEQLLNADVVVADLSTSNKNAYYELGVRHALRPYSTVVICEDGIKTFPFDINHNLIQQYHHMGEGIDFGEVERMRKVLTGVIVAVLNKNPRPKDSPVYTFLNALTPPALAMVMHEVAQAAVMSSPAASVAAPAAAAESGKLYSDLLHEVDEAQKANDFEQAKSLLRVLRKRMKPASGAPEDPYIIQRLALATYKADFDSAQKEIAALEEARALLAELKPETSNDTETLALWGSVHKRLWEKTKDVAVLDTAIRSYQRCYSLRNDLNGGINFAFVLNIRAKLGTTNAKASEGVDVTQMAAAIADFVQARRIREEVIAGCDAWLASHPPSASDDARAQADYLKRKYWVLATKAEALLGIGKPTEAEAVYQEAYALGGGPGVEPWMLETTQGQRAKLDALLTESPLHHIKA